MEANLRGEITGQVGNLRGEIAGLRQEMNTRIDLLHQEMNTRIDGVNTKMGNVDANLRKDISQVHEENHRLEVFTEREFRNCLVGDWHHSHCNRLRLGP